MMERKEQFTWEYLEEGPEVWKVVISQKVILKTTLSLFPFYLFSIETSLFSYKLILQQNSILLFFYNFIGNYFSEKYDKI